MYNFQRLMVESDLAGGAGLALQPLVIDRRPAHCDLTLAVVEGSRDISIRLDYRCGRMEAGMAELWLRGLGEILETMARDPGRGLSLPRPAAESATV
jgi:hypothetical protein